MSGKMPPPFVCYHPRSRWVAEGTGFYSTGHSEYTLTGYRCGICGQWIPPDAVPWPTDEEVLARLSTRPRQVQGRLDRLGDQMMTEAGKRLLARLSLDVPWFIAGNKDIEEQMVAAIEAEAVAAERARIAEVVRGLPSWYCSAISDQALRRAAVLAAIDGGNEK